MDVKIWENTIVAWLNLLSSTSPIDNINQIDESILSKVVQKISKNSESSPVQFLKNIFQNLAENDSFNLLLSVDYLCASTLLLMHVSLSKEEGLNEIRDLMCVKLETTTQVNIVQFLKEIEMLTQEHDDLFKLSYEKFKFHIFPSLFFNFKEIHCTQKLEIGDEVNTPVKNDVSNTSLNSPLQGFFMTPKRNKKNAKNTYTMCGDGDYVKRIKKLTDQLVEEETEKSSLQEQLKIQTLKCNELELKLKSKIEEMIHLNEEWEKESKKNEYENNALRDKFEEKVESEKKLKNDLAYLENYISKLELDRSNDAAKISKLENQLKSALEKLEANETQLKETSELCVKLQSLVHEKETELEQFKEQYASFYQDEKGIDISFMNGSFDKSVYTPENLGEVVVDKLLREKVEENAELLQSIEELKTEKNRLIEKIKELSDETVEKSMIISEVQTLKKELSAKVESLDKSEKEVFRLQKDLVNANAEITKLNKENFHLIEKYNILNNKLQEREEVLKKCNHSKVLLQINFLKMAEDFKTVQQRLESEVKNISMLAQEKYNQLMKIETDVKPSEISEVLNKKGLKNLYWKGDSFETEGKTPFLLDSFLEEHKGGNFQELFQNFENQVEWMESKASLQKTCNKLNDHIVVLKAKTREFAELQKQFLETNSQLEKNLKEAEEKIALNSFEKKKLAQELEAKEFKIKELEMLIHQFKNMPEELFLKNNFQMQDAKISWEKRKPKVSLESGDQVPANPNVKMEAPFERQEFSDSLEEVPVNNKTFDIVHLEERNIIDKTFSIRKDQVETLNKNAITNTAWVVSPPSKVPLKIQSKESLKDNRRVQGESWLIPVHPNQTKEAKEKKVSSSFNDLRIKPDEVKIPENPKQSAVLLEENERLKSALMESIQKRKKDKELVEKNMELLRQSITTKYEAQLEHLKTEMKQLYNRELAKHKHEQSSIVSELQDQNKRYKEHIDELRNQLWDLGEKLLQEQTANRDWQRTFSELKEKYEYLIFSKESEAKSLHANDLPCQKETSVDDNIGSSSLRPIPNATFPTMPTEDEEEVFDNRFLEDMKLGVCKTERPEDRLKELQYRNSLCLPHLKSSYPGETQFHNPSLFKETDLKFGLMPFGQESQSLTDSDHSMTRSLLPEKGKKKEQTSYKRPGPPTPSKNGGRLSIQSGDLKGTPRNVLKELNDQNERNKGTPNPLKLLLSSRSARTTSLGGKDENTAPVTPRKKNFFRKPFGARDH